MQTVEFNVPASQANGTTVSPPVRDQYRVIAGSIVTQNTGIGNDWAIFTVLPNTQTGLFPAAAQGATFQLSNTQNPANVRITGFGVDGPPPNFGAGGPRDATNQTQQTHVGTLSTNTGGANSGTLRYNVDTQGGNSGSPVIVEGSNTAIGIHTNGGCTSTGGTNAGTSFRNQTLWTAIGIEYSTDRPGSDYRDIREPWRPRRAGSLLAQEQRAFASGQHVLCLRRQGGGVQHRPARIGLSRLRLGPSRPQPYLTSCASEGQCQPGHA